MIRLAALILAVLFLLTWALVELVEREKTPKMPPARLLKMECTHVSEQRMTCKLPTKGSE